MSDAEQPFRVSLPHPRGLPDTSSHPLGRPPGKYQNGQSQPLILLAVGEKSVAFPRYTGRVQMHPLLHPTRCIVPCIIVHQISQLSPHVLIQSMRTSFCIYRYINRQNTGYNYQIWATGARNELLGVISLNHISPHPALFSLLIPTFRGRHQRFIKKCTLCWTITEYRPQCKIPSKVSRNRIKMHP